MFKHGLLALAAAGSLGLSMASAQTFGPPTAGRSDVGRPPNIGRPTVSPYLNLMRGGLPAVNYYGLVRPQIELEQSMLQIQQLQQVQSGMLNSPLGQQPTVTPLVTGHGASFFNTSHYYPMRYPVGGTPNRR